MKYLALVLSLALLSACRVGPVKAVPFVGYSHSTDGTGSNAVHGGFSFDLVPEPVREVATPRPFPDHEWMDPGSPAFAPCPDCSAAVAAWLESTAAAAKSPDPAPSVADSGSTETPVAVHTRWGDLTLTALLAILGTMSSVWGVKKYRQSKEDKAA